MFQTIRLPRTEASSMTLMNSSVSFDRAARAVTSAGGDSSFHLSKTPPRRPRKRQTGKEESGRLNRRTERRRCSPARLRWTACISPCCFTRPYSRTRSARALDRDRLRCRFLGLGNALSTRQSKIRRGETPPRHFAHSRAAALRREYDMAAYKEIQDYMSLIYGFQPKTC